MRRMLTLASAVLVIGACTRTNVALLDQSFSASRTCERGIVMYTTADKAPAGYKEIALLNSAGQTGFTSESGMMKNQRQKAADIGATGIILSGITEPGAGAKVAAAVLGVGAERKGKAMAIWAEADTARVNAVCRTQK